MLCEEDVHYSLSFVTWMMQTISWVSALPNPDCARILVAARQEDEFGQSPFAKPLTNRYPVSHGMIARLGFLRGRAESESLPLKSIQFPDVTSFFYTAEENRSHILFFGSSFQWQFIRKSLSKNDGKGKAFRWLSLKTDYEAILHLALHGAGNDPRVAVICISDDYQLPFFMPNCMIINCQYKNALRFERYSSQCLEVPSRLSLYEEHIGPMRNARPFSTEVVIVEDFQGNPQPKTPEWRIAHEDAMFFVLKGLAMDRDGDMGWPSFVKPFVRFTIERVAFPELKRRLILAGCLCPTETDSGKVVFEITPLGSLALDVTFQFSLQPEVAILLATLIVKLPPESKSVRTCLLILIGVMAAPGPLMRIRKLESYHFDNHMQMTNHQLLSQLADHSLLPGNLGDHGSLWLDVACLQWQALAGPCQGRFQTLAQDIQVDTQISRSILQLCSQMAAHFDVEFDINDIADMQAQDHDFIYMSLLQAFSSRVVILTSMHKVVEVLSDTAIEGHTLISDDDWASALQYTNHSECSWPIAVAPQPRMKLGDRASRYPQLLIIPQSALAQWQDVLAKEYDCGSCQITSVLRSIHPYLNEK